MKTLTALFQSLNVPAPKNIRSGWSSRSDTRVVLTLWSNRIFSDGQVYRDENGEDVAHEAHVTGDKKRREHLAYALEHLNGEVFSIIITRKPDTIKETIESQEVGPNWRVTKFNPGSGGFHLERITFANLRR